MLLEIKVIYNLMLLISLQYCIFLNAGMLIYANNVFLNQSINTVLNTLSTRKLCDARDDIPSKFD